LRRNKKSFKIELRKFLDEGIRNEIAHALLSMLVKNKGKLLLEKKRSFLLKSETKVFTEHKDRQKNTGPT